tara:strand:- start:5850 stop:9125 length:3276 start_codon:yes stop_codon:yes gene_type:complete
MPLLNTSIPNLAQGVSQQPDNLRYPGQCDEQVNAWSTVVEGLVKRPNSRFSYDTGLGANISSDLFSHYVDRDEQNKYVITYDSVNGLKARDLTVDNISDGEMDIIIEDATAGTYVAVSIAGNPLKDLTALTIADSTFIVNKAKTVDKETTADLKTQPLEHDALIFVKLGDYEKTYSIHLDGLLVPFDSSLGDHHDYSSSSHGNTGVQASTYVSGPADVDPKGNHADTEFIARDLTTCLDTYITGAGTLEVFALSGGSGLGPSSNLRRYCTPITTFHVDQFDAGVKIGSGAGGTLTVVDGIVTGSTLTQKGTGYDSTVSTAAYNTGTQSGMLITVRWTAVHQWYGDETLNSGDLNYLTPGVVMPTIDSATVAGTTTKFTVERNSSIIKISSDTDFMVRVSDGLADQGLGVIYKEVDNITDLPKSCFNSFRVKIIGDTDLEQDDYYVRFKTKDNEDFGEGSWVEEPGWYQDGTNKGSITGIDTFLNKDTMPVQLIPDQATGKITSFTLKTVDWGARTAGDDNTNPFPSFVNYKINDIFFFKNRLGLLTDDSVVFSEADEYFNFFRTTTQSLLDSAPIDVGISHTKISLLKYAQAFQEKLMLFSAKTQFVLRGADLLTPKTVTISPVTEYDVAESIRPLALSSHIYFNFKRNSFEGLLEYTVDNNTETYGAAEITEQVNKYIPSNIVRMEGSAAENMIVVQSDSDYKKLFVYKYFWQGREKIQSSWMSFTFAREVRSFKFIESTLHIITTDSDGTYLEQIPMENGLAETGRDYALLLDSRIQSDSAYVQTITYTKPSSPTPQSFDGVNYTDVTYVRFRNGFLFKSGMAIYSKNGTKKVVTPHSVNEITILIDGKLANYVNYSSHVTNNGDTYICTQGHTSDANKEPGVGVDWESYWEKITTTIVADAWALAVVYNFKALYKCVQGHTSSASILPTDTNYWQPTVEVDVAPVWSENSYEYLSVYDYFIGYEYDMLYRFSKQNLKQPTERGGRSASDYTYQTIRNGSIEYSETGHFNVEVTPKFRDTYTYTYNPALLASVSTLNKFTPETGFFKFAVQAQPNDATIEIKSSSALPVKLLSAEFESTIISRSRRYGG